MPLGQTSGKSHKVGSLEDFPRMDQAMLEAIDNAIKAKPGADMLINAITSGVLTTTQTTTTKDHKTTVNTNYDLDVFVTGTAVKMEVGEQILK